MNLRRTVRALWAATIVLGVAGAASADETPVSAEQVNALLQRLQQAEARINSLQSELNDVKKEQAVVAEQVAPPLPLSGGVGGREVSAPSRATLKGGATYRPTSTFLQDADDEILGRLEKVENNLLELKDGQSQQKTLLDEYFIKDGSSKTSMTISGRIHGDTWLFPETNAGANNLETGSPTTDVADRFVWRRVRFGVKGAIKDNMEYKIEMEFASPNDTEYRDLYVGWNDLPFFQTLLVGNQKRPYGLDHINSSRYNVFLERPTVVESFNEDARRLGIAAYGVSDDQAWNWRYGLYNMEKTQDDDGYIGDNLQLEFAARLANTWWYDECSDGRGYGHWAIAGTSAHPDGDGGFGHTNLARFRSRPEARTTNRWADTRAIAGAEHYEILALENVFNVGPVQMVGELENLWLSRDTGSDVHLWGGYAYISYFLTGEHMPWDRKTGQLDRIKPFENFFMVDCCDGGSGGGWGAWQVALRYSYFDFNDAGVAGGEGDSLTLGLNWYWNQNSRLQFNYIHGSIDGARGNDADYDIIGSRFMVDF